MKRDHWAREQARQTSELVWAENSRQGGPSTLGLADIVEKLHERLEHAERQLEKLQEGNDT